MIRSAGMALVSVLITLAVVSALTVQTVKRQAQKRDMFALELQKRQLWHQALGTEALAMQLLHIDFSDPLSRSVDRFGEVWDVGAGGNEADGAAALLTIDAQSKININGMLDDGSIDPRRLQTLQNAARIDGVGKQLMAELAEWIDADDELRLGGRESSLWRAGGLASGRTTTAANAPLSALDEIRLMPAYKPELHLPPAHWIALPESTPVNINTATAEVLKRLRPGINEAQVNTILRRQRRGGYPSKQAFLGSAEGRGFEAIADIIDVRSSWFLVQVRLEWGVRQLLFESLVHRDPESGQLRSQYRHWRAIAPSVRN